MAAEKLVLLFGAGASYDCVDQIADLRIGDWGYRPPLVNELFEPRFELLNELHSFPGAEALAGRIRGQITDNQPLESILREFSNSTDPTISRMVRQVPYYLSEFFWKASWAFSKMGSTRYHDIICEVHQAQIPEALYLTVNYDCLLDRALVPFYHVELTTTDHYLQLPNGRAYVKLHGCSRWRKRINNVAVSGKNILGILDDFQSSWTFDEDIHISQLAANVSRGLAYWREENSYWLPAVSIPVEAKTEFVCPAKHLRFVREFLVGATHLVMIGFSGKDTHVLELLSAARSLRRLLVVNGVDPNKIGEPTWGGSTIAELLKVVPSLDGQLEHAPGEAVFNGGFKQAMDQNVFARFFRS